MDAPAEPNKRITRQPRVTVPEYEPATAENNPIVALWEQYPHLYEWAKRALFDNDGQPLPVPPSVKKAAAE